MGPYFCDWPGRRRKSADEKSGMARPHPKLARSPRRPRRLQRRLISPRCFLLRTRTPHIPIHCTQTRCMPQPIPHLQAPRSMPASMMPFLLLPSEILREIIGHCDSESAGTFRSVVQGYVPMVSLQVSQPSKVRTLSSAVTGGGGLHCTRVQLYH